MHSKCTTEVEINSVRAEFADKMTAYGGFRLLAPFFERINLRGILQEAIPIWESSPRWDGDVRQGISMNTVDIRRRHQVFSSVLSWLAGSVHRSFRSTKTSLFNRSSNAPPSIYLQPICRVSASDTGGRRKR